MIAKPIGVFSVTEGEAEFGLRRKEDSFLAEAKRPPLPIVLTANALLEGNVVYFDGASWSSRIEDALVARDDAAAATLERRLATDPGIVEPFLATISIGADGRPSPVHYRDRIRVSGPTFHREHSRSAQAGAA